jgi:hypothetical protein
VTPLRNGCYRPATSRYLPGDPAEHYAVMVPEGSLREGRNRVEVFEVAKGGALRLLAGP